MYSLAGKKILVTGASSGIGRSVSIECSKVGATLFLSGRNEQRLLETQSLLHGDSIIIKSDLNVDKDVLALVDLIQPLDGIVFSAGVNDKSPIKFLNREKIDNILRTNFVSQALLVQALMKSKKIQRNASLVFISSIASHYATISNAAYAASKGALNSFLRVLALELAPQGIRVNGILPGLIQTDILKSYDLQDTLKESIKDYPLGRLGQPEDVAYSVIFLLSDRSAWITGSSMVIDGGLTLR